MNQNKINKKVAKLVRKINKTLAKFSQDHGHHWATFANSVMQEIYDDYFRMLSPQRQREIVALKEKTDAAMVVATLNAAVERENLLKNLEKYTGRYAQRVR